MKPKNDKFFEMFLEAAENVNEGAKLFLTLTQNYQNLPDVVRRLKEIEHQGDHITHDIMNTLNRSFITPLDREDIIAIASHLDSVIDVIFGTADRMLIYRVRRLDKPFVTMAEMLYQATSNLVKAFETLPNGKHSQLHPFCVEVNRLEDVADAINKQAIGELFENEAMNPLEVIKLKEIYEHLEDCFDLCEDVVDILEGVIIKHA